MINPIRKVQLDSVKQVREGTVTPKKLDFAEHVMRIPEHDYHALMRLYPALNSQNAEEQGKAWEEAMNSPFFDAYRTARSPNQVQRSPRRFK